MRHNLLRCAPLFLGALVFLFATAALHARPQRAPEEHPLAIKGARLLLGNGSVIENGTVVMSGGKIQDLGADIKIPPTATIIDGAGKIVTPGFIDARSALLLDPSSIAVSGSDAVRSTADAINRFARNEIKEALENGVTTVALAPTQGTGIAGRGAVVKLKGERAELLKDAAFLAINLEPWLDIKPVNALREFLETKRAFEEARKYREQWQTYEQDLEEYVKKVKELEEKEKAEKAKEEKPKTEEKAGEKKEEKKDDKSEPEKKDKKEGDKREPPPKRSPFAWTLQAAAQAAGEHAEPLASSADEWWFDEPKPAGADEKKAEGGEKKDEKLKKPEMPAKDEGKEILLKALDRKLSVFFGAQRAEAIQNALDLAKDLRLRAVIAGGENAHRLKGAIAEADVPVILGPVVRSEAPPASCYRGHDAGAAATLARAKVRLVLASAGDDPLETRFLPLSCAAAVGHGIGPADALSLITARAAEVLGVQDRVGTLAKGKDADLLVFSSDPLSAGAVPATVIVDGQVVVQR